jgi:hypothetical protein
VAKQLAGDEVVKYSGQVIKHRTWGGMNMADDRMKDDDLRNMGTGGKGQGQGEGQDYGKGQQTPGRNPQGGQQGGQTGGKRGLDDDEFDSGQNIDTGKQSGTQNRGGQNR